jgi:hypothetical protein
VSRRSTPAFLSLAAAVALGGCADRTLDIDFVRSFHLEGQEEPAVLAVMPTNTAIQVWGLAGGAFRGVEVHNRGTFLQASQAPEPPYWYRFGNQWVFTPEPAITWDVVTWGRPDLLPTPEETSLSLGLSGLAPWLQDEDSSHSLIAWGSGANFAVSLGPDAVPAAAETAELVLADLTLEEHGAIARLPAFKGEAGDSIHVAQLLDAPVVTPEGEALFTNDRVRSVVRGAKLKDGLDIPRYDEPSRSREQTAALSLAEGTTHTLDVLARGNGFDAVIAEVGGVVDADARTRVLVQPDLHGGFAQTIRSNLPILANAVFQTPDEAGPTHARLSWSSEGQPGFPPHVSFSRSYKVNDATLEAGVVLPLNGATSLDATPLVGAPTAIRIDGEEVGEGFHVSNSSPIISWDPPTIGAATGYEVSIVRHTENVGAISWVLYTTETQVRLPPAFMGGEHQEDQSLVVIVTARNDATEGFPHRVQAPKIPYGFASHATPRFTAGSR